MRYPRHAKIFRGQLDVAPLAGVFFLLIIFMVLSSLVYTPGVALQLGPGGSPVMAAGERLVRIDAEGRFLIGKKIYKEEDLIEQLRQTLPSSPAAALLIAEADPLAPRSAVLRLREIAGQLNMRFAPRGVQLSLPAAQDFAGTTSPVIRIAVNLGGQFFFENRLVTEDELRTILSDAVQKTQEPLSLLVLADKATEINAVVTLASIAREAGIREIIQAVQPRATAGSRRRGGL